MGVMDIADRFAALLGLSCIIISIFVLYNIAQVKSSDILYIAFIIIPLTLLSIIWLKIAFSIYTTHFPPLKTSQIFKIPALFKEKEE